MSVLNLEGRIRALGLAGLLVAANAQAQPSAVAMPQILGPPSSAGQAIRVPPVTSDAVGRAVNATSQIDATPRSAVASPALSSTAQSRAVGASAVGGRDGCEPGSALAGSEICRQRIETRASQYGAPTAAPLTSEGRLLVLTGPNTQTATPEEVRRFGETGTLRSLVGDAAGQVSTALDQQKAADTDAAVFDPATGLLGLPPTVVVNPSR